MELSPVLTMIFGALLIGIGGHLSAITPKLWQGMIVKSYSRSFAVILGLLGITLVGGGGALTTYAWNEFDRADVKKEIIISVSKELEHNAYLYNGNNLLSSDSILVEGWDFFPQFRNEAIQYALVSSLFDISDSLDNKWLSKLRETDLVIYDINFRLRAIDNERLKTKDYKWSFEKRQSVNNSEMLQEFIDDHNRLVKLIKSNYLWALTGSVDITLKKNNN